MTPSTTIIKSSPEGAHTFAPLIISGQRQYLGCKRFPSQHLALAEAQRVLGRIAAELQQFTGAPLSSSNR